MSILNFSITPERALVCVDTLTVQPYERGLAFRETSKLLSLTHANAVIAARGEIGVALCGWIRLVQLGGDFDAMETDILGALNQGFEDFSSQTTKLGWTAPIGEQHVAFVGWSAKRNTMCGNTYYRVDDTGFTAKLGRDYCIAPSDGLEDTAKPKSVERMEQLAREQTRLVRATDQNVAIGGRLIIAELTRDSMVITQGCDLDAHAA